MTRSHPALAISPTFIPGVAFKRPMTCWSIFAALAALGCVLR